MGELDEFRQIVRNSFIKARQHMDSLEAEIQEIKRKLENLEKSSNQPKTPKYEGFEPSEPPKEISSTGNQGVQSINQTDNQSINQSLSTHSSTSKDPNSVFLTLTNKEFVVFLTIYQLEGYKNVTYKILADHLTLTSGCVRGHVSSLINKGAPLTKRKINNKITILTIDTGFRSLTSEKKLLNMYYSRDISQQTLEFQSR